MTSPLELIIVECPACGHCYGDCINLQLIHELCSWKKEDSGSR